MGEDDGDENVYNSDGYNIDGDDIDGDDVNGDDIDGDDVDGDNVNGESMVMTVMVKAAVRMVLMLVALEEAVKAKTLCLHRIALPATVLHSALCNLSFH